MVLFFRVVLVSFFLMLGTQFTNAYAGTASQRTLLNVVNLSTYGNPKYAWLYKFIDASAVSLTKLMLQSSYQSIYLMTGTQATRSAFAKNINQIGLPTQIKTIDVFVHLHGAIGALAFADGATATSSLSASLIKDLTVTSKQKLRVLHSTACYGASHAKDFLNSGFKAATGAIGVNADSAYAYPILLSMWAKGSSIQEAISVGNNSALQKAQDTIAKWMGFGSQVNSFKTITGNGSLRIQSDVVLL